LGKDKEFFSGQVEPKTNLKNGFGKVVDRNQNYFFGMFKDNMPQFGYIFVENPLRMVKVDIRPILRQKIQKNDNENMPSTDNTPNKSTDKLLAKNDPVEPFDLGNLESYFSRVNFGIINNFDHGTEYHGEIKNLKAHGQGFIRVKNDLRSLTTEGSMANDLKLSTDFQKVVFTSKNFKNGLICGEAKLSFTTTFSFLDHAHVLRSKGHSLQVSAAKNAESYESSSEGDDQSVEDFNENTSKSSLDQAMDELTLIRDDSSINKMMHGLTVNFKDGKFIEITDIDTTNVAP
jgi:hypothetical protein